jgi:hypothetical protein
MINQLGLRQQEALLQQLKHDSSSDSGDSSFQDIVPENGVDVCTCHAHRWNQSVGSFSNQQPEQGLSISMENLSDECK